jgi:NAD(P)-dependent dehydrogenase (short-subunit alcohol dehydrogenase family)
VDYGKLFRLDGKVAIVTGAARGIGAAISEALAQAGATVVITDILAELGEETASKMCDSGMKAAFMQHDVTNEANWESIIESVMSQYGQLDTLVNNAGIETAALITQCDVDDFRRVIDVNVTGVFLGHKHALRVMKSGASIINLSSVAGMIGTPAHIAYHTSKGAVRVMTKAAAIECAQLGTGVRVNSLHPAIVETDMGAGFVNHLVDVGLAPDSEAAKAAIMAIHPMGFGQPRDVAGATLFLASEAARWITGAELVVDGGLTAA